MFYHFLAPEGGHPAWEDNSIEKKYQNALSHTGKLNQQKEWDFNSNSTAKIIVLLTNHETHYNLILCCASTHILSQSLAFL